MAKLVLLFTVVPLVELWLLLFIGGHIGFFPTVALTIFTAFLGAFLAKREGRRVFHEWQKAVSELRVPDEGVLSGILVLVGAVTLVTPGILTDITGLLLLFPPTRRRIADVLRKRLESKFKSGSSSSSSSGGFSFQVIDFGAGRFADDEDDADYGRPGEVIDVEGHAVVDGTAEEPVEEKATDSPPRLLP